MKKRPSRKSGKPLYEIPAPVPLSVSEPAPPSYTAEVATARVFQSGNSQAVRLPRDFRVQADELLIFRRGTDIVLREKPLKLSEVLARTPPLPNDFPDDIPDSPPDAVEEL